MREPLAKQCQSKSSSNNAICKQNLYYLCSLMEWIMWWTGSKKITSICCTICKEQSLVYCTVCKAQKAQYARHKIDRYVENRLFCKKKLIYRVAACFASWCRQLVVWQNISQQQDISTKHQHQRPNSFQGSPILSIRFEVLNWHVSAWRCWARGGITSIPTSIAPSLLPRLCCPSKCTNCTVGLPA